MKVFSHHLVYVLRSKPFIGGVALTLISAAINSRLNIDTGYTGTGALNIFLFCTQFSFTVFIYTAPMIGALAYTLYFGDELLNGGIQQILIRTNVKKYTISRLITSFLMGGFAITIGLLVLLLGSSLLDFSPAYRIREVFSGSAFSEIYDKSILGYAILVILNSFIFCGVYSVLSAGILMISNNKYFAIAFPTAFYILSTMSNGINIIFGSSILPRATFVLNNVAWQGLLKDHIIVLLIGVALFLIGMHRWRVAAE